MRRVTEADDDAVRAQKIALTLVASIVVALAVIWVATYLALGLPVSAAIPFAYRSPRSQASSLSPVRSPIARCGSARPP